MSLLEHQINGAMWLYGRRAALLADEPGLGKTRTVLAALPPGATLAVVCPAVAVPHWTHEAEEMGIPVERLYACSYQAVISRKGAARRARLQQQDVLALDEIHMLSNPEAQRTRTILAPKTGMMHQGFASVFGVTGTPMARHPGNLYPMLAAMAPHLLDIAGARTYMEWIEEMTQYEFRRIPGAWHDTPPKLHVTGVKDAARLHRLLTQPYGGHPAFMLRRTERDAGLALPALWWQWRYVAVDTAGVDMTIKSLPDEIRAQLARLPAQLMDDPRANAIRYALEIAKIDAVMPSLCDEIAEHREQGCVIVAHHRAGLDSIAHHLHQTGLTFVRLDGSTPQDARDELRRKFQAGEVTVFLGSIGAMQTSLTLTRAHRIVIFSPGWTGDSNVQVVKRIHRISQTQSCRAELLVAAGTLEEAVMRQVEAEIAMSESIIDGGARPIRASHMEW